MYFNSVHGGIEWLFSKGLWIFIGICVILAGWKVFDILVWLFNHITIGWS